MTAIEQGESGHADSRPMTKPPSFLGQLNRMQGVTLVETMATVAILTLLFVAGVPAFKGMIERNRITSHTNDLMSSLNLARSEAVKRGVPISICKSADGATCGSSGVSWSNGWIIFVNNDDDGPAVVDSGETILRVFSALPNGYTLNPTNNFTNYLTYNGSGWANNVGTFAVCANSDEKRAKAIVVTRVRPRLAIDTDTPEDGIPNKENNNNISSCETP